MAPAALPPEDWSARFPAPADLCVPASFAPLPQVAWAVPLWSERGLIGVLLLGERRDDGLYTQEEIAIARTTGERLIDLRAGAELARRLLAVQRQRLTESYVIDQQTRRVLHDDVLPELHTALLILNRGEAGDAAQAGDLLAQAHRRIAALLRAMPLRPAVSPAGNVVDAIRQLVQEEMAGQFQQVSWQATPAAVQAANAVPPVAAEVVYYAVREAVRNAARHGRGDQTQRPLSLTVEVTAAQQWLVVAIEDNGVGLTMPASVTGSGQGLALHTAMLAVVGATLAIDNRPGTSLRVTIQAPLELSQEN